MIYLYGINAFSINYSKEFHSKEIQFVTTNAEERYGYHSISVNNMIDNDDLEQVIIFSSFLSDIIDTLTAKGISKDKVYIFSAESQNITHYVSIAKNKTITPSVLWCFYDLNYCHVNFDYMVFLIAAEIQRLESYSSHLNICIVLPYGECYSDSDLNIFSIKNGQHVDDDFLQDRIQGILLHLNRCFRSVLECHIVNKSEVKNFIISKDIRHTFPDSYITSYRMKQYHHCDFDLSNHLADFRNLLKAPDSYQDMVARYIRLPPNNKRLITITLREYGYQDYRNSNTYEWVRFIDSLDKDLYHPIIIRDTHTLYSEFPECSAPLFNEASLDLKLRIALYEKAYINLSVSCGPSTLFFYINNCRSIEFREVCDQSLSTNKEHMFMASSMIEGEQPYYANKKFNRVSWKEDTFINIKNAFDEFCKYIEDNRVE